MDLALPLYTEFERLTAETLCLERNRDDYLKPLSVRWLCTAHHAQWHDENGEGVNGS
jgi:hypothetical protein